MSIDVSIAVACAIAVAEVLATKDVPPEPIDPPPIVKKIEELPVAPPVVQQADSQPMQCGPGGCPAPRQQPQRRAYRW